MIRSLFTVAVLFLLVGSFASPLPAQASLSHPAVVLENPADTTPHIVLDGGSQKIMAFEKVGNTIYAGGVFAEVMDPTMTTTYSRQNFFAFDSETGIISPLNLSFNGIVTGIEASEDETALFISGAFDQVNGITRRGIAKYDLVTDQIDPAFAPTGMRTVSDIKLVSSISYPPDGALIAAGNFDKHLMAMHPTTGADLGTIDIEVAGVLEPTDDPTDETRVMRIAVSPDGTRLVATGNFTTVGGESRNRAFMLDLGPTTATLSTWHVPRFDEYCGHPSRVVSAQGVDFSPDGSYFVIVSTGGPHGIVGLCDAAARFETNIVSNNVEPTWINWTGGDSLWSVAVTGAAVYVGGHQRWLDNPDGWDTKVFPAVDRPGIGAIDPATGLALAWNPTITPLLTDGTRALLATPDGLWVGSDGERFGGEDHVGIGFAPLDLSPEPDTTRPDTFIDSGPSGPVSNTSATFSFSASEQPATFLCRLDDAAFAPCTSPVSYENLTAGDHPGPFVQAHFDADEDGFVYIDNAFSGASESAYADGVRIASGGFSGGALQVTLGNVDNAVILDMSGGWQRSFNLSVPTEVGLSFRYNLSQTPDYENDEISQILVSVDGNLHGTPPNDYVAQIVGNGEGGDPETTGWQLFQVNLGTLSAGNHTLTIGGYNNKKTYSNESTDVLIDEVLVTGGGSYTFQVVAVDESYNMDASPAEQRWTVVHLGSELIGNPGFEVDTSGWAVEGASNNTLTRVTGGHSGDGALEVCTTDGGTLGLTDSPNWVSFTEDNSYTASIWARSDTPGLTLTLRVREYAGGVRQGTVTETVTLTPSWQQVTANYTPKVPGSSLDFEAYTTGAPADVCFQADDASITAAPINDPPAAVDDSANTGEDTAVIIDVAANDSDPNGNLDPTSVNTSCGTCADPANGTLVNHGNGTITYTPDPGFAGLDSFVYEICDTEPLCDTATADITVKTGDCDGDCDVDGADLALLISEYLCDAGCTYDLTGDGIVDENDLAVLALHYGELCP